MVCLSCTATGERVCLAAEGFGNRHCFLENIADKVRYLTVGWPPNSFSYHFLNEAKGGESEKVACFCLQLQNIPPDLSQCVFVIEQALSVRALQELVTAAGSETVTYHFFITREHRTTIYIYIYTYIIENIVTTFTKYLDFNNFNNYSIPPRGLFFYFPVQTFSFSLLYFSVLLDRDDKDCKIFFFLNAF